MSIWSDDSNLETVTGHVNCFISYRLFWMWLTGRGNVILVKYTILFLKCSDLGVHPVFFLKTETSPSRDFDPCGVLFS